MVSRADRGVFAEWWWTVDKFLLFGVIALMIGGVVLSLAGSPPVAERIGLDSFHFVKRHVAFLIPTLAILIATSLLSPRNVRRATLIVFVIAIVLMFATLFIGQEVKGARRWINLAGFSLQPSEFMKPAFVVLSAWLFTESSRGSDIPGNLFAILLLTIVVALLVAQPDLGQTMLVVIAWSTVFFLAGLSWIWIGGLAGLGALGILAAYTVFPHFAGRINRFLDPATGDTFQVDTALESVLRGGWFGRGPGEGVVKRILPDSHTDFIFAVAAEEFGIILCMLLVLVFAFIVIRGLSHSLKNQDAFVRLASAGLMVLFGVQSCINMSVNLNLMPAKGMTLPFVSYGGSSMLALAFQMGLVLALTRRRFEPVSFSRGFSRFDNVTPKAA
ncbi:putative lipid II flippase FtsW [Kaistia dalseonensis]|uniref:Probable peptidoglycan glycosyltransferase FtsW n=1 Tax=Kaistia dalseonensis TaxID=410840 RepID=A0ABU0HE67_9HYPH|nr:putative lipid II flippase FtsW [Kaistia dalseonensis]MCX5497142.1 putative lipid II flippase FtsW [Kaistia dalseonensis]MDQ0439769.1 cell division protein FtsW [Kaistia dalseonensis]